MRPPRLARQIDSVVILITISERDEPCELRSTVLDHRATQQLPSRLRFADAVAQSIWGHDEEKPVRCVTVFLSSVVRFGLQSVGL